MHSREDLKLLKSLATVKSERGYYIYNRRTEQEMLDGRGYRRTEKEMLDRRGYRRTEQEGLARWEEIQKN